MLAMKVEAKGLDDMFEQLLQMPKIIEKAVVAALAETVKDIRNAEVNEMKRVFDAPTNWLTNGLIQALPTGRDKGQFGGKRFGQNFGNVGVYFEDFPTGRSPSDVVRPHIYGGTRRKKANEKRLASIGAFTSNDQFAVMGAGYPRNKEGNIPGSVYARMLSDLGAIETAMPTDKKGNPKAAKFFVMKDSSGQEYIAERVGGDIRTVLVFVDKVNYKVRYEFHKVAQTQFEVAMPRHLNTILKRYMIRM
jgi:hypothetical protein